MTSALVCTWQPRGDLPRLVRLQPFFELVYTRIIVAVRRPMGMDAQEARHES